MDRLARSWPSLLVLVLLIAGACYFIFSLRAPLTKRLILDEDVMMVEVDGSPEFVRLARYGLQLLKNNSYINYEKMRRYTKGIMEVTRLKGDYTNEASAEILPKERIIRIRRDTFLEALGGKEGRLLSSFSLKTGNRGEQAGEKEKMIEPTDYNLYLFAVNVIHETTHSELWETSANLPRIEEERLAIKRSVEFLKENSGPKSLVDYYEQKLADLSDPSTHWWK